MNERIAIIEDDRSMAEGLVHLLELQGYAPFAASDFGRAAEQVLAAAAACALVDLRLPGADGHDICRELRAGSSELAILVLTSSDAEFDEVMALRLGADDYVCKPYRPAVLLARIDAALERHASARSRAHVVEHAGVTLDLGAGTISYQGKVVDTTRNEQHILHLLLARPGQVITRSELMRALWESDEFVDDNTLTVNITRVRATLARIGAPEDFIETRRGLGYVVR